MFMVCKATFWMKEVQLTSSIDVSSNSLSVYSVYSVSFMKRT